jgi:Spy/CpxP family protein refolding chaperone
MMSKRTLFAVSLLMLLVIPAALFAQKGRMERRHGEMGCMSGEMGLDLDPEQRLAVEKSKLELELANIGVKAEQVELRKKIKEEMLKEEPSRKTIDKYAKAIAANREKMQMNHIDHALEIKKILGPEQWKMFVAHHWDGMGMGRCRMDRGMRDCRHGCKCFQRGMRPHMESRGERGECLMERKESE